MRHFLVPVAIMLAAADVCGAAAEETTLSGPVAIVHEQKSVLSVNNEAVPINGGVAVLHASPSGMSKITLHFYPSHHTQENVAALVNGNTDSLSTGSNTSLELAIDKENRVTSLSFSVPGATCGIANSEEKVNKFLQEYSLDGTLLTLKTKGTYTCDLSLIHAPSKTFNWDMDILTHIVVQVN